MRRLGMPKSFDANGDLRIATGQNLGGEQAGVFCSANGYRRHGYAARHLDD